MSKKIELHWTTIDRRLLVTEYEADLALWKMDSAFAFELGITTEPEYPYSRTHYPEKVI